MRRWRRASRLAAIVASLATFSTAHAQHAVPPVTASDVATYAGILRAADARQLDSVALAAGLRSPKSFVRTAAARALAQLAPAHRAGAIPWLRSLLDSPDAGVLTYAAFGLGLGHDSASVPRLAQIIRDGADTSTARAAAWSLGEIGASAGGAIDSLLADRALHPAEREYVLLAAARIRAIPLARITPYLTAPDTGVRWAAAYAIARARRPGGARALLALRAQPAAVRAEIARALTASAIGDSLRPSALARVRSLARDADPAVRIMAAHALGTYGSDARTALVPVLRDRDPQVRVAAAQSLSHVLAHDSIAWSEAWRADTAYRFRRSLLESAAAAGYALPGAGSWRDAHDWRLRAAALSALATAHDTAGAIATALHAVHDRDARVRGAAYGVLASLDSAARDPRVRAAFDAARSEPDTIARNAVPGLRDTSRAPVPAPRDLAWYERVVRAVVIPSLSGHAPRAVIRTERGPITVALYGAETPLTVWNFSTLARRGLYDGLRFHRVVPAFVAQDGDPRGDGEGGPPYTIRDELTPLPYARGAVGMALSGPDTGGSQYFLTLTPQPHLDGHYTVFGMVTAGLHAMDALREGDLIRTIRISNVDPK